MTQICRIQGTIGKQSDAVTELTALKIQNQSNRCSHNTKNKKCQYILVKITYKYFLIVINFVLNNSIFELYNILSHHNIFTFNNRIQWSKAQSRKYTEIKLYFWPKCYNLLSTYLLPSLIKAIARYIRFLKNISTNRIIPNTTDMIIRPASHRSRLVLKWELSYSLSSSYRVWSFKTFV